MNFNVIPILVRNEKVIAKQFRLLDTLSTEVLFVAQRHSRHNLRCSFRPPLVGSPPGNQVRYTHGSIRDASGIVGYFGMTIGSTAMR
jgi:hypothetical protein